MLMNCVSQSIICKLLRICNNLLKLKVTTWKQVWHIAVMLSLVHFTLFTLVEFSLVSVYYKNINGSKKCPSQYLGNTEIETK